MKNKLNIIAIIPARYASTRLPAKPLIDLCGKPMIQHVYERTKRSTLVDRVIVATDHEEIVQAVKKFNGEVMMTPPDLKSGSDRIAYAAKELDQADIIVNVQGDEPLVAPETIDETIRPLINDTAIQVGTAIKKITLTDELTNPNIVKVVIDTNDFALYFSRSPIPYYRDDVKIENWHHRHTYYKHFGLYVFRRDFLFLFTSWKESMLERTEKLEQLRIIENGYKIKVAVTEHDSVPVDTMEDADRVRSILKQSKAQSS
jgi:3-deoxy-manno-octulosonate cytidylyltransferase (CMP-KDO synthetase)